MATKLKNLKITKVDFVDEGANPDAHVMLFKSKAGEPANEVPEGEAKSQSVWSRLVSFIGKAANLNQDEIDSVVDEIQKGDSTSFSEKYNEAKNRKIVDEIWDICYSLQASLCSILNDEDLDSTETEKAMKNSVKEFDAVMNASISKWATGKEANVVVDEPVSEDEIEIMQSVIERIKVKIDKATGTRTEEPRNIETKKSLEGDDEMKIDKSKMTPAERAFYEDLEKRYALQETAGTEQPEVAAIVATSEPSVAKSLTPVGEQTDEADDIYKGLHPAVKAEMEALRKFRDDAEDRELQVIAKKYEIIGKKTEDLVPVLKSLKAVGGTAYGDMIAMMDSAVEAVEKSAVFQEVGKSGHGSMANGAWAKAEAQAIEIMKSKPGISKAAALDEVLMSDPALAAECEKEE